MPKTKGKELNRKVVKWAIAFTIAMLFFIISFYIYKTVSFSSLDDKKIDTNESQVVNIKSSQIKKFEIFIPSLNVSAPIIPNVDGTDKESYFLALTNGVAHYKGTGLPGSESNIFIFGHSSKPETVTGDYDNIFSKINDLKMNEEIIINFNNRTFNYLVSEKKVIKPDDLTVLNPTNTEQVTLMTCWPIGNNTERIIIVAKKK